MDLPKMSPGYSAQFSCAVVVILDLEGLTADEIIEYAWDIEALYGPENDLQYVVQFPDRGCGEVYTESALRASIKPASKPIEQRDATYKYVAPADLPGISFD